MKRLLGLLMAVMVMMGGISCAVAENANPIVSDWLTELKSKRLIQIVEDEIGEGWTLYQPNGREEEENFSSAENLKEMRFLPVVAAVDFEAAGRPVESKRAERPRFDAGWLDAAKFFCYALRKF